MKLKKYKLGEICNIIAGGDAPQNTTKDKTSANLIPVYSNGMDNEGLYGYTDKARITSPSYTISARGTIGVSFLRKTPYVPIVRLLSVIPKKEGISLEYLYYYSKLFEFKRDGSVQQQLTVPMLSEIIVNLPSFLIQKKIATVLSSLDEKIVLNKKMNQKLEAMAKHLYDYWFVQFDFPDKKGKPYKSSGGKMAWNEQLKRVIPEGWEVKPISEMLKCDIPGDWGEEEKKGNYNYKVNCVRGCDMIDMTNLPMRFILQSNSKKLLQTDDFIIEISGGSPTQSTGRIVQVTDEIINRFNKKVICSNFCHGIRISEKEYISYFSQMWNMFYANKVFFNFEGKTSGLKNFQFDTFIDNKWYFPPECLAKEYNYLIRKIQSQIDKNDSENKKLILLRDRLLPLLMNGQVEVG